MISESTNRPKFSETQITTMAHLDIIDGMTGMTDADIFPGVDISEAIAEKQREIQKDWNETIRFILDHEPPKAPYITRGLLYLLPPPEDYQI